MTDAGTPVYRLEPGIVGTLGDSELATAIERLRERDDLQYRLVERGCGVNRALHAFEDRDGDLSRRDIECLREVVAAASDLLADDPDLEGVSTPVARSVAESILAELDPDDSGRAGVRRVSGDGGHRPAGVDFGA